MTLTSKTLFIALLSLFSSTGFSQQTIYNFFYRQNWQLVNPAAMDRWQFFSSRNNSTVLITGGLRQQWFEIGGGGFGDAAPKTAFTSVEIAPSVNSGTNVNNPIRVGFMAMGDKTDAIGSISFHGNFAYYIQLNRRDFLHLGISAGYVSSSIDGTKLRAQDQGDELIPINKLRDNYVDFSIGAFYRKGKRFYAGFSIPQIVSLFEHETSVLPFETGTPLYLVLGSFLETGDWDYSREGSTRMFTIEPSIWVRYAVGVGHYNIFQDNKVPLGMDADLRFYYRDAFWIGGGYGTNQMANAEFGYMKKLTNEDRLRIGLSYGIPLGQKYLNLGHSIELTFSYGVK